MNKNYLTIQEAAEMLSVSVQTVRNWGETGELKEIRTPGGHRRYDIKDVEECQKRWKSPRTMKLITSWEMQQDNQRIDHIRSIAATNPLAEKWVEKGGFSKVDIGMLLNNMNYVVHNPLDSDDLMEIFSYLSAPYILNVQVMSSPCELLYYKRIRTDRNKERRMVCECEDVTARTICKEFWGSDKELMKEVFIDIFKEMDTEFIQDIVNNACICNESTMAGRYDAVANVIKQIDDRTFLEEPKFVMYPPELWNETPLTESVKLTPNLAAFPDQNVYVSRLVPPDTILVGMKSDLGFYGYSFCPYMLGYDKEQNRLVVRYGKKLMREGSIYFGVVKVK